MTGKVQNRRLFWSRIHIIYIYGWNQTLNHAAHTGTRTGLLNKFILATLFSKTKHAIPGISSYEIIYLMYMLRQLFYLVITCIA